MKLWFMTPEYPLFIILIDAIFAALSYMMIARFCALTLLPDTLTSGKLRVLAKLNQIILNAERNGLTLEKLQKKQLKELEPELIGEVGLLSRTTGIIDIHDLMLNFLIDIDSIHHSSINSPLRSDSNGGGRGRRCLRVQRCNAPPSETHLIDALSAPLER